MSPLLPRPLWVCGVALGLGSLGPGAATADAQDAQDAPLDAEELALLSIEELMEVQITSVSGTAELRLEASAAVTVVTNESIRRSGATTIPEALRGVPGIHVGRVAASSWAVSSRGFSSVSSEKLLVLSDTRSIYTPLYSGVFWDVQDYLMEDIDRVEVIRGPGATLWGSNAVNGVINITTKNAEDTQGVHLGATTGTEDQVVSARYGGRIGDGGFFRVFGKYVDRDRTYHPEAPSPDDARLGHVGFRADWDVSARDALTLQGDAYRGDVGQITPSVTIIGRPGPEGDLQIRASGGNILGRWRRTLDDDSDIELRAYYDYTHRNDPTFVDDLHTLDLNLRHRFAPWARHELTWGLEYRYMNNENTGKVLFSVDPPSSRDQLVSGFVQDQIAVHDRLRLTLGTKLEHNDFSGFEAQPSVRLGWDVGADHDAWAAVSRAVRVPTRLERDIAIDASDPTASSVFRLLGNEDFGSEVMLAYELGYRWRMADPLFVDVALFHHRYEGLASLELGTPFTDPGSGQTVTPIVNRNLTDGVSQGVESLATFSPTGFWRLTVSHSYLDLDLDPAGDDLNRGRFLEGATPRHQIAARSLVDLPSGWQIDAMFRHLTDIRTLPAIPTGEGLAGYSELDLRLAWGNGRTEVSVVGHDLLHERHVEFGTPEGRGGIERGVYARVTWRF